MTIERKIAKFFNLTDENWMKHSNPISVWTRYSVLPIIVIAFWSRKWFGWWCLVPGITSILWMLFNPILFKKPNSTKNWASKAVLGERVFSNRDKVKIPKKHEIPLHGILNTISSLGMILAIWSIVYYSIWGAVLGVALAYIGKSWYLDRMVWLYEDMKPDLIIKTPFDVWMDVVTGEADGGDMLMEKKYKAEGDMELLLNMNKFFGKKH